MYPGNAYYSWYYSWYYRYRIGDYRLIYSIKDEVVQVFVVAIAHRSEVYKQ
ncbi:MAG: type II toxin-antitoxin system RelE/ParE family toxin [Dolichospermum sp.]|nr:type II toxin-antitoxin system RelE/ParE family toxin [Dolichospermum sp.]